MAFKPNYRQERAARTRTKEEKKQEKLAKREAETARRRQEAEANGETLPATEPSPSAD